MSVKTIAEFHANLSPQDLRICDALKPQIDAALPDATRKIWHRHPVWFLADNPIAGYSKLKDCVRLMFWSGASFDDPARTPGTGKFKDASIRYTDVSEINAVVLAKWLDQARAIQWDYKNVAKRKGKLERLV